MNYYTALFNDFIGQMHFVLKTALQVQDFLYF